MSTQLFDLTGKVALVTGASRGIGEAIARLLAEQGAHVLVSSRKLEGCQSVVEAIQATGGSAEALPCHIGNMESISEAFAHIRNTRGRLDILVNNGATNPYYGHVLDTDLAAFEKTVEVNIRGYFFMTVEAGKLMRDQESGGSIINTASIGGMQPAPGQGIYSITKGAVITMTRSFAKELGEHNIRVNALLPGLTRTKFASAMFEDQNVYDSAMAEIPLKRHAEPQEMAGTVLYLASAASSYTTGDCIVVDGGLTI